MATVCEEVLERASLAGVGDAEIAGHLQGCARCREEVRGLQAVMATRPEPSQQMLVGFAARTRAKLAKEQSGSKLLAPLRAAVVAGAVAAAGVGGVLLSIDKGSAELATGAGSIESTASLAAADLEAIDPDEELFRLELLADPFEPLELTEELYASLYGFDDAGFDEFLDLDELY